MLERKQLPALAREVLETQGTVVIFSDKPSAVIGVKGATAKAISVAVGKRVKVIDARADDATKARELLEPLEFVGMATAFTLHGLVLKVRARKPARVKQSMSAGALEELLGKALGKKTRLEIE